MRWYRYTSLLLGVYTAVLAWTPSVLAQTLTNPLGSTTICQLFTTVLNAAAVIGAPIAVMFVIVAGAKFVFAMGKPAELEKARQNLVWTLIGIAVFFGAIVITDVIFNTVNTFLQGNNQAGIGCTI